jgi:putative membrane protein
VVVTVLIIVWMMRAPGGGGQSDRQGRSPLDVLKDRFARGEIDVSEYEVRRQHLSR